MSLAQGIVATAKAVGIDPLDLATVISYETGGTFDPTKTGPTTKWGTHRGLIQFGEPQARRYGVNWDDPVGSQLGPDGAVARYLRDAGVTEGMGLLDIYSAVNAGSVGRYDASDAAAGGMPGTVRDKVEGMGDHRRNAERFMGGVQVADASGRVPAGLTPVTDPDKINRLNRAVSNVVTDPAKIERLNAAAAGATAEPSPVPEGMVFDPERNMYVDAQAMQERASQAGGFGQRLGEIALETARGVPFVGEAVDETIGAVDEALGGTPGLMQERVRAQGRINERDRPGMTLAANLAGGFSALPAALAFAPASLPAMSTLGLAATGMGAGALGGAAEGAVSGYLAGEGEGRMQSAMDRGLMGAGFGAALGAAAPVAAKGVRNIFDYVGQGVDRRALGALGLSDDSAAVMQSAIMADGPQEALENVRRSGAGGMIADAGPATAQTLDLAVNRGGGGSRTAREAVEGRAAQAGRDVTAAMDEGLGTPRGVREVAKEIADSTRGVRQEAYERAYSVPINYASRVGREIEDALSRVDGQTLRRAVEEANAEMRDLGLQNQQIMARFLDDGVEFIEMPNVRQLDEVKKALDRLAKRDEFGRLTPEGLRPARQAKRLRDALVKAVPDYGEALKAGGDKIAQDNGLRFGQSMLSTKVSREDVAAELSVATPQARRAMMQGLRSQFDEALANVKAVASDPNIDARQARQAIRDLSSPAAREKLTLLMGKERADKMLAEVDRASRALELRANVARNSATQPRQAAQARVDALTEPGILQTLAEGEPVGALRKVVRALASAPPAERQRRIETMFDEIATFLTQARGPEAQAQIAQLLASMERMPQTRAAAEALANRLTAAGVLTGYQSGMQSLNN